MPHQYGPYGGYQGYGGGYYGWGCPGMNYGYYPYGGYSQLGYWNYTDQRGFLLLSYPWRIEK
jgi:hypothetical protein